MELKTRQQYLQRIAALRLERQSWFDHWKEISEYLLPRSGRFFITDRNRGQKKHNSILDSTATRALRILAAGMMAGMTSPARPWFRLATQDEDLMEYAPVKLWLDAVTKKMRNVFNKSNTYRALHSMYGELGAFNTAANLINRDFDTVIHLTTLTAGEYMISTDDRGNVNTLAREFEMTVGQMVEMFGREVCSTHVQNQFDRGNYDAWVPVYHLVEPRRLRDYTRVDNKNMAVKSVYFEAGAHEGQLLRESGFKRFPGLVSRWDTAGQDIYGNGPGMEVLGDIKQLMHQQLRKGQGIDYKVKPPLQFPAKLKNAEINTLPGGAAYHDMVSGQKIEPMFDPRILDLSHLLEDISDVRDRINKAFYVDLFLMLAQSDMPQMTAREVAERHEEKLLMLGPVLERLQQELLSPIIDNTFDAMIEARIVPPPPEELQGQDINVRFVGMLAQAQQAVGTQAVDRLLGTVGSIAVMQANSGMPPTALDKLDTDQVVDAYADMLGVDPNLIVADDKVALVRDERVKAQQAAQNAAAMQAAAETAKTASQADMEGNNALTQALGQFSGYSVPGTI